MRVWGVRRALGLIAISIAVLPHFAIAQDVKFEKTHGPWIDSRPFLKDEKPAEAKLDIAVVNNLKNALITGFKNPDHHNTVLVLQQQTGTLPQTHGIGYLAHNKDFRPADANATHATRWSLFRHAKTFAGKEIRIDVVPESIKRGFRFDQSAPATAEAPRPSVFTGPQVKYGLILKNIEPSEEGELRLAALQSDSDYAYFQNAPKAEVQYEVGPIAIVPGPERYNFHPAPEPVPQSFNWKGYIPDHRFRGKFSPRGLPTGEKPIPDQTLTLEQVQGYYNAEVQFVNGFKKESMLHRFNLPIYGDLRIYEEFTEDFKPIKLVLSNAFGQGYYANFEHYFLEKRYRSGFFYRMGHTNIEVYANLPDNALNPTWKKLQRWEFNVLMAL